MREDDFTGDAGAAIDAALDAMDRLEAGAVANPDEGRRVGHYWLRAPARAPEPAQDYAIERSWAQLDEFAARLDGGALKGSDGCPFEHVIWIGIGGSALGPQLLADALAGDAARGLTVLDNTDPDGIQRALAQLPCPLARALVVVVSKSGSTVETRNGMREVMHAYARAGLELAAHAVAITGEGSTLDQLAAGGEGPPWLARFPLWSWVGGRTSVCSTVGLVLMALLGIDWRAFLAGAAAMDDATRARPARRNPAALLARMWHRQAGGRGEKVMVVLPYRDRLVLLSRYLQQLIMESLGKRLDRAGQEVWQGLTVLGNKGSTDQHAYVQQLRDGLDSFFAIFVRVLEDREPDAPFVEPGVRSGDCLDGFYLGTRAALRERGRASATLVLTRLDARALGAIVALFERAVGLYAELININAYHQPGVEAGKQAARAVLEAQARLLAALSPAPRTAAELAAA
ncbi:MAG: glucose-6-phosphate isomerase, partial [Myxococcales bacterium]|nr:glucose-6-phosphate isomerase [Myxococcales bacterium]